MLQYHYREDVWISMVDNFPIDTQSTLNKEVKRQRQDEQPKRKKQKRIEARFGQNVRLYRMQRHYTQAQLAFYSELNQNYISDIEGGKRNVTLRVVDNIARALGVEAAELIR